MVFDVSVAMTWILFLALFPIAFFGCAGRGASCSARTTRRSASSAASRQPIRKDSPLYVCYQPDLRRHHCPGDLSVVLGLWAYETWSAVAGVTIWGKFIADFILSRHAHPIVLRSKK